MKTKLGKTDNAFSTVAKAYRYRYGYNPHVVAMLSSAYRMGREDPVAVDLGAGTGVLTRLLSSQGWHGFALEPDEAMRREGPSSGEEIPGFGWEAGTAENTMLPDGCADWVCMGDAFHWTDRDKALPEIRRILKTGGHFTAIWSLRDLENDPLQRQVDHMIRDLVPGIRRVYEDVEQLFEELPRVLSDKDGFTDCIEVTGRHREPTPPERYLGMWGLSYDVQSQAGPAVWPHILDSIEALVRNKDVLTLQYVTRSWSATAA